MSRRCCRRGILSLRTCFRRCRRDNFYSRCAFDVVDEVNFTPGMLSTLSTRRFSLPMCFRRCRRSNFYSRCAFDVVDEMFLYSRCAFDVVDGIIFTPDVLSTLSTRQFSLPMCFRRCRRSNFHSRCVFDAVDGIIFTPDVQSDHHFVFFYSSGMVS